MNCGWLGEVIPTTWKPAWKKAFMRVVFFAELWAAPVPASTKIRGAAPF
jgi:hypothetical protein